MDNIITIYYCVMFFITGAVLGSFYNVVGYRLPKKESLVTPSSHCTTCGHKLGALELIPIFSFLFQQGKCKNCGEKISWFYTIFEFLTALCFMISYLIFGISIECLIALVFISILIIIMVSDYHYMIISDSVLLIGALILSILIFIMNGLTNNGFDLSNAFIGLVESLAYGVLSFATMYLIKCLGDFIFKKESMGGGDIKLMFIFGLVLGYSSSIMSIFIGSLVGFPISLIMISKKSSHEIPFGPFLSVGALILLFTQFDFTNLITFLS